MLWLWLSWQSQGEINHKSCGLLRVGSNNLWFLFSKYFEPTLNKTRDLFSGWFRVSLSPLWLPAQPQPQHEPQPQQQQQQQATTTTTATTTATATTTTTTATTITAINGKLPGGFFFFLNFLCFTYFCFSYNYITSTTSTTTTPTTNQRPHTSHFIQPPSHSRRWNGNGSNSSSSSSSRVSRCNTSRAAGMLFYFIFQLFFLGPLNASKRRWQQQLQLQQQRLETRRDTSRAASILLH